MPMSTLQMKLKGRVFFSWLKLFIILLSGSTDILFPLAILFYTRKKRKDDNVLEKRKRFLQKKKRDALQPEIEFNLPSSLRGHSFGIPLTHRQ